MAAMEGRVLVVDDEAGIRKVLERILRGAGYQVECAGDAFQALDALDLRPPDAMILDIKMPGMDGLDAVRELTRTVDLPFILVSAYHDAELIERAGASHVMAYLVKPIAQADLETAIAVAWRRFEEFRALRSEAADLRQALEDRKTIERAKGILMKRARLDEAAAFERLRKLARNKSRKMVDVARMIVLAEKAIDDA